MSRCDVLVIGGGVSGAGLAFHAARSGAQVLVIEKNSEPGGCLSSERTESDFWYELGAHTCYNSYGSFLELLEGCGLSGKLQKRAKPVLRFLDGDEVVPGTNFLLLVKLFGKGELIRAVPRWFGADPNGQTVQSYYSRLVGSRNYERVLGPMLSAVPSQSADAFPADMLFKKRERRKDVVRSFTLPGGLQTAVEAALGQPGIDVRAGAAAVRLERSGSGFSTVLEDGSEIESAKVAIATPPGVTAELLREVLPELAAEVATIHEVQVDSLGFAVPRDRVKLPDATFYIPLDDKFHSVVTRDVLPDPRFRGFTFHFRPGQTREARIERAAQLLRIRPEDMESMAERSWVLPSPVLGHSATIATIDRLLVGEPLAISGNWFGGLSIEDCVLRSRAEWTRLAGKK